MENSKILTTKDIEKLKERLSNSLGKLNHLINRHNAKYQQYKKDYHYISEKLNENIQNFESLLKKHKV